MSEALKTFIVDKLRQNSYVSAPIIAQQRDFSLQYIGRVLNMMERDRKLRMIGKIGTAKYYVLPRSQINLQDVERSVAARELMPTAWMGIMRSPQEFVSLLNRESQATARKLFDADEPDYYDYFREILPAIEMLCHGRRANTQTDLDMARTKIGIFTDRIDNIAMFLRQFLDNDHIKSGAFADALSDFTVNNYRDSYTREEAS